MSRAKTTIPDDYQRTEEDMMTNAPIPLLIMKGEGGKDEVVSTRLKGLGEVGPWLEEANGVLDMCGDIDFFGAGVERCTQRLQEAKAKFAEQADAPDPVPPIEDPEAIIDAVADPESAPDHSPFRQKPPKPVVEVGVLAADLMALDVDKFDCDAVLAIASKHLGPPPEPRVTEEQIKELLEARAAARKIHIAKYMEYFEAMARCVCAYDASLDLTVDKLKAAGVTEEQVILAFARLKEVADPLVSQLTITARALLAVQASGLGRGVRNAT